MPIINIDAIKVPNKKFMSYGVNADNEVVFIYGHDTMRGAQMKTTKICKGTDKHWNLSDLKVVGWQEVTEKDFREGVRVWV